MAAWPSLFCHGHNPVLRARNGTPNEQQIPLGIHSHHPESKLGVTLGAHVPGHPLPLDDAGWIGAWADRARLPVAGVAVGGWTATEVVPVNHALESPSLGCAGNLHQLAGGEDIHLDLGSRCRRLTVHREDPKHLRRSFKAGLLGMTQRCLAGSASATGAESQLHAALADLYHAAGPGFDYRHWHRSAIFREHSGHPELAADQSHAHWLF